jgi:hypothetical protein
VGPPERHYQISDEFRIVCEQNPRAPQIIAHLPPHLSPKGREAFLVGDLSKLGRDI